LLKPALSSGQLKCIGATTYTEFRGVFEKDHALSRRFQKIDVNEPTVEQTMQILRGLKSRFRRASRREIFIVGIDHGGGVGCALHQRPSFARQGN
jgi:ATP-dependent Clp protease ATP-binding subunit ClpA